MENDVVEVYDRYYVFGDSDKENKIIEKKIHMENPCTNI